MKQEYHSNAVTNLHNRREIKKSSLKNSELANLYNTSTATISKWRHRENIEDKSSQPSKITYALNQLEHGLALYVRQTTWLPLDEIWEILLNINQDITRSSVYRTFCRNGINKVPQKEREKAKKFKAYEPGYLHVDVTYLPKIDGKKQYLFVAIDRATRLLFYKIYDAKTAENAEDFIQHCITFFPFVITHILTDNGLEFTNALLKSKNGNPCTKPSKVDKLCESENIDHRLTKPNTPKTNGMVERVNGIIKNATIMKDTYKNRKEMNNAFMAFLAYYILYKRHGGLRRELNVKTPYQAIEKWFELKPEIFTQKPLDFKNKILHLSNNKSGFHKQRCET